MFEPVVTSLTIGGARFLTGMDARWVGCMHDNVQRIYFANHTSHMDFVLVCSALPGAVSGKKLDRLRLVITGIEVSCASTLFTARFGR